MSLLALPDADGVRVLRASGELDVEVVPPLLPGIPALVAGAGAVVLDLSLVEFFDSSGVRLVDVLARACAGLPLRVAAPPGTPARRVLELVGMVDGLVSDDVDSAVAAVR
jgi:anti-anti-sigma factor